MQQQMRKLKKQWHKSWNNFLDRLVLAMKITLSLIVLFFGILFFIIKPAKFIGHESSSWSDEAVIAENQSKTEFVETLTPHALEAQETYGTRPSLLIAQAALESNWGTSTLSKESNNYFGIKGSEKDTKYATKEFDNEEWTQIDAAFKHYDSLADSINDYASLLKNGTSWDQDFYEAVFAANDYKEAALAVQEAGYATDPTYADKLIRIIEQYQLYELDF